MDRIVTLAIVGTLSTGVMGIFMAINAMILQDGTSAGMLLIASAVAFGSVTIALLRPTGATMPVQRPVQNGHNGRTKPPLRIHE